MNLSRNFILVSSFLFLVGCANQPRSIGEALMAQNVQLSLHNSKSSKFKFELISVADDLTTKIHLDSGEELSGKPGDYFPCDQFGSSGLQLISSSHNTGIAIFKVMWSEPR